MKGQNNGNAGLNDGTEEDTEDDSEMNSDVRVLQNKLASLKDELLFWRRSERVSRQCLKALLQERLSVGQEDCLQTDHSSGMNQLTNGNNARSANQTMASIEDRSSASDGNISIVLSCLRYIEENEQYVRHIVRCSRESKAIRLAGDDASFPTTPRHPAAHADPATAALVSLAVPPPSHLVVWPPMEEEDTGGLRDVPWSSDAGEGGRGQAGDPWEPWAIPAQAPSLPAAGRPESAAWPPQWGVAWGSWPPQAPAGAGQALSPTPPTPLAEAPPPAAEEEAEADRARAGLRDRLDRLEAILRAAGHLPPWAEPVWAAVGAPPPL